MCRKLSVALYARIEHDPLLRPLFPGKKSLRCATEEFAAFLTQFFGGPAEQSQERWWVSLRESHLRFKIGPKERASWMSHLAKALEDVNLDSPVRSCLREFFEKSSAYVVNTSGAPVELAPVESAVGSSDDAVHEELSWRWDAQCQLDKAVAAIRAGDAETAIALAESPLLRTYFERNRSVLASLLGAMIGGSSDAMLRYVRDSISADPALGHECYRHGRTLLHEASAQASLTLVEFLLRSGADPNATEGGGHTPLYSLANECMKSGAGRVVHALVECGANVNADGGVKRCTALHMAARRGNVEVAKALMECGANIEARDSLGDTPLRRAVNCEKAEVAALLLKLGADVSSIGSKGLTPLKAARGSVIKQLLKSARSKSESEATDL
jgi:hemoglobin